MRQQLLDLDGLLVEANPAFGVAAAFDLLVGSGSYLVPLHVRNILPGASVTGETPIGWRGPCPRWRAAGRRWG